MQDHEIQFEKIADDLANAGYTIVDNFLSLQEVHQIRELPEWSNIMDFAKAGTGKQTSKQINESIRGDYIRWIDERTAPAPLKVYLSRLNALMGFINESLFLSLRDCEVHMTIYPVGTFYKRHLDQFQRDDRRKLSVICYVNEEWTAEHGGQLRLHLEGNAVDVLPVAGRFICLRSDLVEHEVLPATRERRSLTGWMRRGG